MNTKNEITKIINDLKAKWEPFIKENKEEIKKIADKIANEIWPTCKDFFSTLFKSKNIIMQDVEMLSSEQLYSIAREHIVANSNEVIAYKEIKDDTFYVYLAYSKDRELLDEEKNFYVIIKADGLSKDVKELFKESELVILK